MLGELQANGKKIVFAVDSATILTVIALGYRHTQTLGVATHLTIWPSLGCGPIWLALGVGVGDDDVPQLRREFVARFRAHPPSSWSARLLLVVNNAIDIQFGVGVEDGEGGSINPCRRPRLTVIK